MNPPQLAPEPSHLARSPQQTSDSKQALLPSPAELATVSPLSPSAQRFVGAHRQRVISAVRGQCGRQLVIVGPCSIHDVSAALDYAHRLRELQRQVKDQLVICMRAYFEKPRTSVGWKGLVHDPHLNGSGDVLLGLTRAHALLVQLAEMGVGVATELLDPLLATYFAPLVSWAAIGARTSESQIHRELASDLDCALGIKNATDGSTDAAVHGAQAARQAHTRFSLDAHGRAQVRSSAGNPHVHPVLRGGKRGPNYQAEVLQAVAGQLAQQGLPGRIMVDCSHGNSLKQPERQALVLESLQQQLRKGSKLLLGVMLESHLKAGAQAPAPLSTLNYGQSVTDACLGWTQTRELLLRYAETVARA